MKHDSNARSLFVAPSAVERRQISERDEGDAHRGRNTLKPTAGVTGSKMTVSACPETCRKTLFLDFFILFFFFCTSYLLACIDFPSPSDISSYFHYFSINVGFSANNWKLHWSKSHFSGRTCHRLSLWILVIFCELKWMQSSSVAAARLISAHAVYSGRLPF